ncbi:MAG TPA: DinB family protein [Candidatus Paceibacterota bacterium]|nr:DinB family protein [Candidatus Paceibacterota bacterium]
MTNKDFFLKLWAGEGKAFENVFKAINEKKWHAHKPDPKSKTAKELAIYMVAELDHVAQLMKKGALDMGKHKPKPMKNLAELVKLFKKDFAAAGRAVAKLTDKEWEKGVAALSGPFGEWKDTKQNIAWGYLVDLIHHRGQLSTYLRAMGGKVPSIYGPSADSMQ